MKKRTRIIAAFLTLIMVVGLLPLSLFAAENAAVSEPKASEKSWASVKSALEGKNFIPVLYEDFEAENVGAVAQSTLNTNTTNFKENVGADGKVTYTGASLTLTRIVSRYVSGGRNLQLKNYRQVFSIAQESNQNKALYHGNAASTAHTDHNDTYFDIMGAGAGRGHDLFVSLDIKMGGKNIASTGESLIDFINRDNGRFNSHAVWVSNVGGLYLDKNFSPENLIGYLNDTEYTNISVHVKLSENKYYVYLNDVLVNPEGKTFVKTAADGTYNNTGKKVIEYALSQIRVYTAYENINAGAHAGLYYDNVILASRAQQSEHNTDYKDLFVSSFSKGEVGHGLIANESMPGKAAETSITLTANSSLPSKNILSYVKDGDDTVLKVGKPSGTASESSEQIYFSFFGLAGYVKKNYSISIDFKMGSETLGNKYTLIHPKNRSTGSGVGIVGPTLETDGRIMCGSKQLGTASTEGYTRLTLDIAWNEDGVKMYYYVDGVHVHTGNPSATPWGDNENAKYLNDIAFIAGYGSSTVNLKENELYVKNVTVSLTDRYNSGNNVYSPFKVDAEGFVKVAGITRYFNSDGTIKKEDFTVDGVKYLVGYNGSVLGAERDGIEMSYADYFTSTFTYGTDKNVKLGESLTASTINASLTRADRAAYNVEVELDGVKTRYYASYINNNTVATNKSQDSYWDYNMGASNTNNVTVIKDFDIMLDAFTGSSYGVSGLVTTKGLDASGKRTTMDNDTYLLSVDSRGWLKAGSKFLVPLSKTEFTKISVAVHTPTTGQANGTYDVYVNGVLMVEALPLASGMYGFQGFRSFEANRQSAGMYLKNISIYTKTDRPMQYYTHENGSLVLTSDQTKTPVKASDLKSGTVNENGIVRYYDSLGLPVINGNVTVNGETLSTDAYGKIVCGELNHLGEIENGNCPICGEKADAVTSLYGNSLILGSDVRVVFYLDINLAKSNGVSVEIGRDSDYAAGTTVKTLISELGRVKLSGKTYYKVDLGIPAKDLADVVTARIVRPDGTTGTEYKYSAKEYVDTVKAQETSITYSAELKALVSALEVYSALAEKDLEKTDTAVDVTSLAGVDVSKFTDAGISVAEATVGEENKTDITADNPNGLIVRTRYSLVLDSNIKMLFTFKLEVGSVSDYVFKIDGSEVKAEPKYNESGVYCVENTVTAKNLNKTYTLTVENGSGDVLVTLTSSVLGFAMNNLAKSTDETHKNLMKAIFNYWQAADMYVKYAGENTDGAVGIQSAIEGKTVYSFGDSLVAGHKSGNGMVDGLAKEYGMVYTKYAKNGATVNITGASVYAQVLAASNVCPDFIVFDGLTNDVSISGLNYPIGEISDGYNGPFDTTTFCGSLETTVKLMREKYPTAHIVFVTPHKMPTRHLELFKQLVDLALEMCEKWGITVANVYYDGEIDTTNDAQRVVYSYNNYDESEGNGNGTHLSGAGYDIFYAPIICGAMAESAFSEPTVKDLIGKTVYSFGDSLIDGNPSEGYGMLYSIVSEYGLNYTEYAFRGSAINIHNADQTKVVYNQLTAADSGTPDYIIFNGLTNDVSNITESSEIRLNMGTISDGFDAELDTTTFCGSFETILRLMKEKYPNAKIIYVTPHKMDTKKAEGMRMLVETAVQICEKWGITVADVYNESGLDLSDADMKSTYGADGCHLNGLGYETFYKPLIVKALLDLI